MEETEGELKLSELTNEQKSRWICAKLGWIDANGFWCKDLNRDRAIPDMVNDPAMTVMLMNQGPICVTRCQKAGKPKGWTAFKPDFQLEYGPWPQRDEIGEAVADAFMLAHGWRED